MLKTLNLRTKIMIPMTLMLVLSGVTLTQANLSTMRTLIHEAEQAELNNQMEAFTQAIGSESRTAEAMSALVADMPLVQEKLAQGDRQALADLFVPNYAHFANTYGIDQFQFHLPPATSFLRIHRPQQFGDDLSNFRISVVNSNKTNQPMRGLEKGATGLGIRGISPINYQGKHIGSVELGMNFGQAFFDHFKANKAIEANVYLMVANQLVYLAGTTHQNNILPKEQLRQAFQGTRITQHIPINGTPHAVLAQTINDYSGNPIGVVEIAMNNTHYQEALDHALNKALIIEFIVLLLGMWVSWYISQYITKRINQLRTSVKQIEQGDLTQSLHDDAQDEIGKLTNAIDTMRSQLHTLANDVSEHAHSVHKAALEITKAVEGQAATSSQMSASVSEITSTMEELSASSTQIAEHSKSVVDVANQAMSDSYKGSEAMQQVLARMQDIRNDNQASLHEIIELGNKSKQISKIMTLINAVADQTKLIAFNAALEASSAGEAGKRFSVVAGEIRRLADSVTESTNEIESKISEIQDSISRLVITSEKGSNGILAGTTASNQTATHFNDIVAAVNQTSTAAQQISLSTQQQKTASNQVVVALREIVGASAHTATSVNRIAQISRDMLELAEHLSQASETFKLMPTQPNT